VYPWIAWSGGRVRKIIANDILKEHVVVRTDRVSDRTVAVYEVFLLSVFKENTERV
jgi:hypothetical protein